MKAAPKPVQEVADFFALVVIPRRQLGSVVSRFMSLDDVFYTLPILPVIAGVVVPIQGALELNWVFRVCLRTGYTQEKTRKTRERSIPVDCDDAGTFWHLRPGVTIAVIISTSSHVGDTTESAEQDK